MTASLTPATPQARSAFRISGMIAGLSTADRRLLFDRAQAPDDHVRTRTSEIIRRVRQDGDRVLRELAYSLDGVALDQIEVPRTAWREAAEIIAPEVRSALERAARNIRRAHEAWLPSATEIEIEPGVIVGRRPDPLARAGVYAPGGRALYPSSVLMGAIPARVAGVGEVIVCSPPGPSGIPAPIMLAAAEIAGVDRVFAVGGAVAIAAMAYGTQTIPRADRIAGPGNAYVAAAKLQVAADTGIDAPAGPSELLIITDHGSDAEAVAREVLAQAEHDPDAAVVVIATNPAIASAVARAVQCLAPFEKRADIIAGSLAARGALLVAPDVASAIRFSNDWAPEHLLLAVRDPDAALREVVNAGTVCLGTSTSVVFGDYMTGANHVLPTGGAARRYSGLSTLDFVRWTTYQRVSESAARSLAGDAAILAMAERLPAHAAAAKRLASR
jgi:histidinol dehydrogenase